MFDLNNLPKCPMCCTTKRKIGLCEICKNKDDTETELVNTLKKLAQADKYANEVNVRDILLDEMRAKFFNTCQICLREWKEGERRFDVCKSTHVVLCRKCRRSQDEKREKRK